MGYRTGYFVPLVQPSAHPKAATRWSMTALLNVFVAPWVLPPGWREVSYRLLHFVIFVNEWSVLISRGSHTRSVRRQFCGYAQEYIVE